MPNKTPETYPNQRTITVNKKKCDKDNKYTTNNLAALDEAAFNLQSKGGFKLYIYIAKNQDKYSFALSSRDFISWSGLSRTSYRSAFEELEKYGYLVKTPQLDDVYVFYDTAQNKPKEEVKEEVDIIFPNQHGFTF